MLPLIRFADHTKALIDTGIERVGVIEEAGVPGAGDVRLHLLLVRVRREEFRDAVKHLPFTFFSALPPPPGGNLAFPCRCHLKKNLAIIPPVRQRCVKAVAVGEEFSRRSRGN